jgi:DMSO/TMAO reductase YedYZ molybdopterin-dependent catalytic subunit
VTRRQNARMPDEKRRVPPLTERKEAFAIKQASAGKGVLPRHLAGAKVQGTGEQNRHGMPRLPPGQRAVPNWPVLDLGVHPQIAREEWRLEVDGLVARPLTLSFDALMALPQVEEESDFHCVTTWSRMDMRFGGVRVVDLLSLAEPADTATHLLVTAYDEDPQSGEAYTTNVSLAEAVKPDVLLVHTWEGKPLPREHGGPVRMVTPQLYAWKGAKWIRKITVLDRDHSGFWERRGYSDTALPWYDDRYSRR